MVVIPRRDVTPLSGGSRRDESQERSPSPVSLVAFVRGDVSVSWRCSKYLCVAAASQRQRQRVEEEDLEFGLW